MKTATAATRVVASRPVPRRPSKPKAGEPVHISFYEDGGIVLEIDEVAKQLASEDPHGRKFTRTDAVRSLIRAGIASRKQAK